MSASGQPHPTGPGRLQEVSEQIYAYVQPDGTWWINNMGMLAGRSRTTAIDSSSTVQRTEEFRAAIAATTSAPLSTLINTHHHGDHTNGNFLFPEATIVAHEECRRLIVQDGSAGIKNLQKAGIWANPDGGPEWGDIEAAPPFLTYLDGVNLYVDELLCEVRYIGMPAHTTNDSIIWIPDRQVLFSGDLLFNGGTPFLLMGSVSGAMEAVSSLRRYPVQTILPGHGPVCGPEVIDQVLAYLTFVMDLATHGHADGITPLELACDTDLGEFAGLSDPERIVGNLHRAYLELGGAPRGASIDGPAALGDMITYNGGKPLTCLA